MNSISTYVTPRSGVEPRARRYVSFLLLLTGLAITGCGQSRPAHPASELNLPPAKVRVQTVGLKTTPAVEEVLGTVRARLRASLEAKVSGRIEKMPVTLGQKVKSGELIAQLDVPELKARLEQAQAGLQQAERQWERMRALFVQQAVTRSEHEAAEARHLTAQAAVAEAKAMMAYVQVRAPFDGVVTRKWADVGDLAAPGKLLVDVEDPSAVQLEADVPEAIAARIKPQARLTLRVDSIPGELTGTVSEIGPTADPVSRTSRVKLDLASTPSLMTGQFARLIVPVGERSSLLVPTPAVIQRGQMEIVFAVEKQHGRLHLVKTGRQFGDETEILSGLDPGDAIVVEGAAELVDGQPVEAK